MWAIIMDKLIWSLIIIIISTLISWIVSRMMLKRNLKSDLYKGEIGEIKALLKDSLSSVTENEPIFVKLHETGYIDRIKFDNEVKIFSLKDTKLEKFLKEYSELIKNYNGTYFRWNKNNLNEYGEPRIDIEERDKELIKFQKSFNVLYDKINLRIEKIMT